MNFKFMLALTGLLCCTLSPAIVAQTPPSVPPGILEPKRPELSPLPATPPASTPPPTLSPPAPPATPALPTENITIKVQRIEILGNTIFSPAKIDQLIAPFENQTVSFEQLIALRTAITDLYIRNGYTTSGAFLPPQDVSSGVIKIQVVEGQLENIEIKGLKHLRENYVRDRIALAADGPVNLQKLETALQLLQLDPRLSRVRAELTAGTSPGHSILILDLEESESFALTFSVDNHDSPSVGSIRYSAGVNHNNVLGFGDSFSAEFGITEGIKAYNFNYAIPLNARDGILSLNYSNSNSRVIEKPFEDLGIQGNSQTLAIGFRQPVSRTPQEEFTLGLSADLRRSETFILENVPFSFSVGPENGVSQITALRFSQDWVKRSSNRVLAARSQFNLGLGILGATVNETGIDGKFISWLGQFQWVESLGEDSIAIARVATQLTPSALLPLEQFSIGGVDTIRGYRQNQQIGDNGIVGSLEFRFPVVRQPEGLGLIQISPFLDMGTVWNNQGEVSSPNTLISTGLGLRWQKNRFSARLDWGIPLIQVEKQGNSLQDNGLSFSVQIQPF
ncbi:MAG TPA: ShlB/FhaC/HecB family hemolysin secretion/activation protein [Halomicronema sp.]